MWRRTASRKSQRRAVNKALNPRIFARPNLDDEFAKRLRLHRSLLAASKAYLTERRPLGRVARKLRKHVAWIERYANRRREKPIWLQKMVFDLPCLRSALRLADEPQGRWRIPPRAPDPGLR